MSERVCATCGHDSGIHADGLRQCGMPGCDCGRFTTLRQERDNLAVQFLAESQIVDRVWKALGIAKYEEAKPFAIDEHVSNLRKERDLWRSELRSIGMTYCGCDVDNTQQFQDGLTEGLVYAMLEGAFDREADKSSEAEYRLKEACTERDVLTMAVEATLLFHSGSPWDDAKQCRWHEIAEALLGTNGNIPDSRCYDATTKTLCDMQRAAIAKAKP